jgi:hypothetical protein
LRPSTPIAAARYPAALDDRHQPPVFGLRQRTRLPDAHPIAHLGLALLVVRVKLLEPGDDFVKARVLKPALDLDHDGLGHPVRHHLTDSLFAVLPLILVDFGHSNSTWFAVAVR